MRFAVKQINCSSLYRQTLMNRRYFRSSIHELETLFENQKDNMSLLAALEDELEHRKTERAAKLRSCVVMRLTELGVSPVRSTQKQQALWIGSASNKESDEIVQAVADTSKRTQKAADNADFSSATCARTDKKPFAACDTINN